MSNVSDTACVKEKAPGFFRTLFSLCGGTELFPALASRSVARMLAYLLILAVLTSIPVVYFAGKSERPKFSAAGEIFSSSFGKSIVYNGSFVPEKDPDKARTVLFPGFGKVFYFPSAPAKLPEKSEYADLDYLCVWTPGRITFACRGAGEDWVVNTFDASKISFSTAHGADELFKFTPAGVADNANGFTISSDSLFEDIYTAWQIREFVSHSAAIFILPLIYALFLLVVLRFSFAKVTPEKSWVAWWKCGVYAAFPGALIVTAVTILNIDYLSFNTVYMSATMTYGLFAVMRFEIWKNPESYKKYHEQQ